MSKDDPFLVDGARLEYPVKHFEDALAARDDGTLVALFKEWFTLKGGRPDYWLDRSAYFVGAVANRMHQAIQELGDENYLLDSDDDGILPVQVAVFSEDLETLDLLLKLGANINEAVHGGPTAAFIPLILNKPELLVALIDRGADLSKGYKQFRGPDQSIVRMATSLDRNEILAVLGDRRDIPVDALEGARIASHNSLEAWKRELEKRKFDAETQAWVKEHPSLLKPNPHVLNMAAEVGDLERVQKYINSGWDINEVDPTSTTALMAAAENNQIEVAKLLIKFGAKVDGIGDQPVPAPMPTPATPLLIAVKEGNLEVSRLLLENKADPNAMFFNFLCQPVHCLLYLKNKEGTELHKLLIKHGAELPSLSEILDRYPEQSDFAAEAQVKAGAFIPAIQWITLLMKHKTKSKYHYLRGVAYDMTDQPTEAIEDFDAAIRIDPQSYQALYSRSQVRQKQGDWVGALSDLEAATSYNDLDYISKNALANLLVNAPDQKLHDPIRSVELATAACELSNWSDSVCVKTLSDAYRASGNNAKADELTRQAENIN